MLLLVSSEKLDILEDLQFCYALQGSHKKFQNTKPGTFFVIKTRVPPYIFFFIKNKIWGPATK